MKKKTRQVKARPIAAREQFDSALDDNGIRWQPIWTLPRTAEAYDAMREVVATEIWLGGQDPESLMKEYPSKEVAAHYRLLAADCLTALALVRPTTKQGGGK